MAEREFRAHYSSLCKSCGKMIHRGERIRWGRTGSNKGKTWHYHCPPPSDVVTETETEAYESAEALDATETNPETPPTETEEDRGTVEHAATVTTDRAAVGIKALQAFDALAAALAARIKPGVDEATVSRIVRAEIAKHSVVTVRVERPNGEPKDIKGAHRKFPTLIKILGLRRHVYLYGPAGSGKSTAAFQAAEALGLDYGYISLNPMTPDSRLQGFLDANGVFRDTMFRRLYQHGGVFCIDECDNASGSLLTTINSALENGHAAFPDGMVRRHDDFIVVATGNTAGKGANPAYPDRRPFDAAFADRFVYLEWDYDESLERTVALAKNPDAGAWVAWVQKVRAWAKVNMPRLVVTPRASFIGAELLGAGIEQAEVADMVLFKGIDADSRTKVLSANPLPA